LKTALRFSTKARPLQLLARAELTLLHVSPRAERAAGAAQNRDLELGVGVEFEERVVDVLHELIVRRVELLRAVQDDVAYRPLLLVPHRLEFRGGAVASGHRSLLR
jgi:hypothetical protein